MACDSSTPPGSARAAKTASEVQGDLLKALESRVPKALCAELGYTDSSILAKWREGQSGVPLDKVGLLLHACGLKVVPIHTKCIDVDTLRVLQHLGSLALNKDVLVENAL